MSDPPGSKPPNLDRTIRDWNDDEEDSPHKRAKTSDSLINMNINNSNNNERKEIGAKSNNESDIFIVKGVSPKYDVKDDKTYRVNVALIDEKLRISRMKLAQILHKLKTQNVIDVKSLSKNKLCVYFNNHKTANEFTELDLKEYNLKAEIPLHYVSVVGVIRDVPLDMNMESFYGLIDESEKILKLERIYRRVRNQDGKDQRTSQERLPEARKEGEEPEKAPTYSVKVTFQAAVLPKDLTLRYFKERVHPFIGVTRQCQHCLKFGHTKYQCKSTPRCDYCGEGHKSDQCESLSSITAVKCLNCQGPHRTSSFSCPERQRQNNIKIIMATRNLNYNEALDLFPQYTSSNKFGLLENIDEFPTLTRANYSRVLKSGIKRSKTIISERLTPAKVVYEDRNRWNKLYNEIKIDDEVTTPITSNPHKTTAAERLKLLLKNKENQTQQASGITQSSESTSSEGAAMDVASSSTNLMELNNLNPGEDLEDAEMNDSEL